MQLELYSLASRLSCTREQVAQSVLASWQLELFASECSSSCTRERAVLASQYSSSCTLERTARDVLIREQRERYSPANSSSCTRSTARAVLAREQWALTDQLDARRFWTLDSSASAIVDCRVLIVGVVSCRVVVLMVRGLSGWTKWTRRTIDPSN